MAKRDLSSSCGEDLDEAIDTATSRALWDPAARTPNAPASGTEDLQPSNKAAREPSDIVVGEACKAEALLKVAGVAAAAISIQRMYRGYRTRRKLADTAVMAKRFGWWNVLEAAMLQHNTAEFYAYNKTQHAAERWDRMQKKASKVGRGLSKHSKAVKLALQHWLEAVDARHRYGHNLRFYYEIWLKSPTEEPFFYWLDVGGGREVEVEKCLRSKLQKEVITYLGPEERKQYEVVIKGGKLFYNLSGQPVHTATNDRWIFVMCPSGKLYVAQKRKGKFQHSSFLAGGATTAAGRLLVTDGVLELMEAHSGHYRPSPENFRTMIHILSNHGADLTVAKIELVSEEELLKKTKSIGENHMPT